ncbi:MAG TPA: c-type cytochrome [Candidatus Binatia bacterium]|nr:c-type cytochrome [Candidatus Binatia bacterium]
MLALVLVASLAGCEREARPTSEHPARIPAPQATSMQSNGPRDPRAEFYEGNAYAINQGQRFYRWFNCSGCHANGGGGMGPALMDAEWRYGGRIEEIYQTIEQGRPNGMPAFGGKIPEEQIWQIAAYVRSMSGNVDRLAAPSRPDRIRSTPPLNNVDPEPPGGEKL